MHLTNKDRLTKERRSWNMSRIRGKNTSPELVVRRLLHRMGYRFRLHVKNLPGKPDIVAAKYNATLEACTRSTRRQQCPCARLRPSHVPHFDPKIATVVGASGIVPFVEEAVPHPRSAG
jgi:DNA mismatch endonuclease (patch repair protein)